MVARAFTNHVVAVLAVSVLFVFWGIGSVSFLDPDEGMYGSIALEMAKTGDWITPHFNGVRYLEKPPLYFWLTGLTISAFGPSEWAVRLWSALPALGVALLLWHLGELLYGGRAGLLSALVFVSSVGVFRYVRVAATDFLLVFSLTLAVYGYVRAVLSANSQWQMANGGRERGLFAIHYSRFAGWAVLFWLGCALGVLSKGLIGVGFPLLIVAFWSIVNGHWGGEGTNDQLPLSNYRPLRWTIDQLRLTIYSPVGLLLFLGLTVPWHVLAALRNPGFLQFYIVDNQFLRFFNHRAFVEDDIPVSTLAFLILTLVWFFPWSLFLPASLRQGFPRLSPASSSRERLRLLVGLWAVVVLGFFSLSSSKLEHYVLPAVPALSLWVGALWAEALEGEEPLSTGKWQFPGLGWSLGISALGCGVVGVGLFWFSGFLTPRVVLTGLAELNVYYRILQGEGAGFPFASVLPFVGLVKVLGMALAIGLPAALLFFRFRLPRLSFTALLATAGVTAILVFRLLFVIEPYHSTRLISQTLKHQAGIADVIVHAGSLEYSAGLPFYTGRRIYLFDGRKGDLEFGSQYPESRHLYLDAKRFAQIWHSNERVFLVTRLPWERTSFGSLTNHSPILLGQFGFRWLYTNRQAENSK